MSEPLAPIAASARADDVRTPDEYVAVDLRTVIVALSAAARVVGIVSRSDLLRAHEPRLEAARAARRVRTRLFSADGTHRASE